MTKRIALSALPGILFTVTAFAATPEPIEAAKSWSSRDLDYVKKSGMPTLIYIVDTALENNGMDKFMQGKLFLGAPPVQEKLKSFATAKIKADGTDSKGWPADWLYRAKNGAALIVVSSDMKYIMFYDKATAREQMKPSTFATTMDGILTYEKGLAGKNAAPVAAAPITKDNPVAEKSAKKEVPGLASLDQKKDAAKPGSKKMSMPADE